MDNRRRAAERICATLRGHGHRALFAGGCVRDMILGMEPKDYDVATSARPKEVKALFDKSVSVGEHFGVILVVFPECDIEVATFRGEGPYLDGRHPSSISFVDERQDAQRRDFTINAMFLDPETSKVVDYVNGQQDLFGRVLRTVGDPDARFQEDHLRLLRAVRFSARLDFPIEPQTKSAMKRLAHLIRKTSAERIRDELFKMLTEGGAPRAFEIMDETGLLELILPEVARMKGVQQPEEFHPEGDVFVHTLAMLGHLKGKSPALAMGTLLHDVGKPLTMTVTDRIRFNNHDKVGADEARRICKRLRMSGDDTDRVIWLVDQHMRLAHAPRMRESKLKRFIREPGFDELLELGRIDCLASHGDLSTIDWIEHYRANLAPEACRPPRLITGNDLIQLGYKEGPRFREILQSIEDAQLEGTLSTRDDALQFIKTHFPN